MHRSLLGGGGLVRGLGEGLVDGGAGVDVRSGGLRSGRASLVQRELSLGILLWGVVGLDRVDLDLGGVGEGTVRGRPLGDELGFGSIRMVFQAS